MNLRICLLFFLLPVFALAQNTPDSQWAFEAESVVYFDRKCAHSDNGGLSATPLKTVQTNTVTPTGTPFRDAILKAIQEGIWPAFTDERLALPLSATNALDQYVVVDSIVTFDPETYEEKLVIVHYNLLESVKAFKVRQRWSFDGNKNEFTSQAIALAPLVDGAAPSEQTPVWFKLPAPQGKWFDVEHKRVRFATHLKYQIEEQNIRPISGSLPGLKSTLLSRLEQGQMAGYDIEGQAIPVDMVPDIFIKADTIYTVDPESYEENFEIVKREYRAEDINDYQVVQSWFFEPKKGHLQCQAERVAPAVPITDEYGTLSYYLPLFFWQRM
jgi:hypothetical protein